MKNFILFFSVFLYLNSNVRSEEIISIVKIGPGQVYSYEDAVSLSKETENKVFLFFGADWCPSCDSMKNITLKDKNVKDILFKNFIFLIIDIEESKEIKEKYNIKSIPDCIIIDKNEKILKRSVGYKNSERFIKWIEGS